MPVTVLMRELRKRGYSGGISIFKDGLATLAETGSHLSDGVDGSTRTASHCAMLVLFETNSGKEPST
jgi:hypothetical protein